MARRRVLYALCVAVCGEFLLPDSTAWGQKIDLRDLSSIAVVYPAGAHLYAPNRWGILRVDLSNPQDEPADLVATTFFVDEPTLQYGRRVWVPPRSRMQTWHPALIPAKVSEGGMRANFRTLVRDARQGDEALLHGDSARLQFDGTVRVAKAAPMTGIIDILRNTTDPEETAAVDLLIAAQAAEVPQRHNTYLQDRIFAPGEESLHALDQLVMAEGRVADDAAGLEAIRRWLFGGGHLWVMLDRVDSRVLELLLGDDFACEVVDRVGLTTVRIVSTDAQDDLRRSTQSFDSPVDFVRVAVTGVEIAYTVDGWPAAFWKPCGEGWLLVTTLGPRGWMRPRTSADNAPAIAAPRMPGGLRGPLANGAREPVPQDPRAANDSVDQGGFVPQNSMKGLAARFFSSPPAPLMPETALAEHVEGYVGYSIPPRWLIVSLLTGLSLLSAAIGVYLWRQARPELMGWVGPAITIAASVALVLLGRQHRHAIFPTVVNVQFVQPVPGTDDVRVEGVAGLYSPEGGAATIAAERGGLLVPDMAGLEGTTRRMVWNDLEGWRWENLPELAGLRSSRFLASVRTPERIEARATFGPEGITGRLVGSASHPAADGLLATRDGRIGVQLLADGTFEARSGDVFAHGQYLAATLSTDEQDRRRKILEELLSSPLRRDYPAVPQLLYWTDAWDVGFRFAADRKSLGAALVAVPLQWERPANGTHVALPGPLLPYRGTVGPDGMPPGGLWDHRKRRWQEKAWPSATWLRFQVPPVLLPVEVERARLLLHVAGPVGRLEIAGLRQSAAVPLKTWIDPFGKLSCEVTRADLLPVAEDGGLFLRVSGGDQDRPELTQPDPENSTKTIAWRIESLALELDVKTIAAPRAFAGTAVEK